MTVDELVRTLSFYPPETEVRIISRVYGWDAPVLMVENDTYGLNPETQVGIFES